MLQFFRSQAAIALLASFLFCFAAEAKNIDLPRTDGDIVIDGQLDEVAWGDAVQVELPYENNPGENTRIFYSIDKGLSWNFIQVEETNIYAIKSKNYSSLIYQIEKSE